MKNINIEYQKISQKQVVDSAMVIFHGYGDSKHGFIDFASFLSKKFPTTAFYVTNAPNPLMFGGYSWFDLTQDDFMAFENPERAEKALNDLIPRVPLALVHELTDHITKTEEINADKIFYAGFSQGGLISLIGGLTYVEKLGGIIAMSSVPLTFGAGFSMDDVKHTPDTLLSHGTGDTIVPFACFEMSKYNLHNIGANVDDIIVPRAEHNESITIEVLEKIAEFLAAKGI